MRNYITLVTAILLLSCQPKQIKPKKEIMNKEANDTVQKIIDKLNWWVAQSVDDQGKEIESSGEVNAAIARYIDELNQMKVNYHKEGNTYVLDTSSQKQ